MLNDNQKKAVCEPLGKNILVSAAAGSGKTRVLVERVLNLLGKVSLSDMVIMTFTKKATAEMKKKIKEAIELRLTNEPDNKMLIRESAILPSANISTIDSFCKRLLEEYYDKLSDENSIYGSFDPAYRIADEKELDILYNDVLSELLEKRYEDKKYKVLFDAYIEKCDEKPIRDMLIKGIYFLSSITWPDEYLKTRIQNFEKESIELSNKYIEKKLIELKEYCSKSGAVLDDLYDVLSEAKQNLELAGKTKGAAYEKVCYFLNDGIKYMENLLKDFSNLILDKKNIEKAKDSITALQKPSFPAKNHVLVADEDRYKEIVDKVKDVYEELIEINDIYEMMNLPKEIICNENEKLLLELLYEFFMAVVKEKKVKNIYAIGDYANLALDILYDKKVEKDGSIKRVMSDAAKQISDKYSTIFVDEYQDTNYIQEYILYAISDGFRKKNTFVVGDIKQSIYGFRNAEPKIFSDKYKSYGKDTADNLLITLDANYRSRASILRYVNDLFTNIMHEEYGDVNYERDGMLGIPKIDEEYAPKVIDGDNVEIDLITTAKTEDDDKAKDDEKVPDLAYEAEFVAKKIDSLVKNGECHYKDIVILLRSIKGKAEYFLDALSKYGVPVYSELNKGFFNRFEIKLLISILRIIDNPLQNIELVSVLTSDIFDVKNKELALLKIIYQEAITFGKGEEFMLQDAISYFIENIDTIRASYSDLDVDIDTLKKKLDRYKMIFDELVFKARYLSISELIDTIYEKLSVREIVGAMIDGKMRVANLDILYQNARSYESSSYVGLFNFLRYVEKILSREDDQGQAKLLDENDDVVRIMTIHASKGLEFPVVFLANAGKKYNNEDIRNNSYYNRDYGVALHYIDKDKRYDYTTPKTRYAKELSTDKNNMEEMRLLYVALTRAKSKLYITSFVKDLENVEIGKKEYDVNEIKKAGSYLRLILDSFKEDSDFCTIHKEVIDKDIDTTPIIVEKKKKKDKKVNFDYKYDYLRKISPKFSVTSLKQKSHEQNNVLYEDPQVSVEITDNNERVDGTIIGTAYHRYMQFYDYEKNEYSCPHEDMTNKNCCINFVKKEKIEAFLDTALGKKMREAFMHKTLYREHKFMKLFSQNEINEYIHDDSIKCDEKNIIIQGIIDAFLIEKGEDGNEYIVLIDYKTDKINDENIADKERLKDYLVKNYKVQLQIYAKILSELTGLPVKEAYIYSFALDEAILIY